MEGDAKDLFISELDREIGWQWKWEKRYRHVYLSINLLTWLAGFLILVLSFYQVKAGSSCPSWVILAISFLAMLSVSLPVLSMTMKYQQRQQVYDQMARAYTLIRIQLITDQISL